MRPLRQAVCTGQFSRAMTARIQLVDRWHTIMQPFAAVSHPTAHAVNVLMADVLSIFSAGFSIALDHRASSDAACRSFIAISSGLWLLA